MFLPLRGRRGVGVAAVLTATVVGPLSLLTMPTASAARLTSDRTSPLEARRVDRVKTPKIDWFNCADNGGECALIRLPMDYDRPNGRTTQIALARIKAAKPKQRIGTLFVNPGGPSGEATDLALGADQFLDRQVLDRFDIVGVDPRGVGAGDQLRCFKTFREQRAVLTGFADGFPVTPAEIASNLRSARAHAKACGTTGGQLAASMSTAEVARDMDVVRRALGDKKLNFLGFSYGTQLGQVYANMFPDRVRAIVLDGVIDPVAWTTGRNGEARTVPTDDRQRTADATYAALRELMLRCDKAGAPTCAFAGSGNSLKKFDVLMQRLRKAPITIGTRKLGYASVVYGIAGGLYSTDPGSEIPGTLQNLYTASEPSAPASQRAVAGRRAAAGFDRLQAARQPQRSIARWPQRLGRDFGYGFRADALITVTCSDSVNPKSPKAWIAAGKAADRRAPYFGSFWNWRSNPCADSIWTARDEDRYMGPFTKRTVSPVLFVGNYYDPATPYRYGAVVASKLLPNSRLLTSNSWGHTAYGNNACVADAVGEYLLRGTLPAKGAICVGSQPFEDTAALQSTARRGSTARPVPIRPFFPGLGG